MADASQKVELSPSLGWGEFNERAVLIADNVLYQKLTADSHSASSFSFNIRSPSRNALLDNEVIMEYTMNVGAANMSAQLGGAANTTAKLLAFVAPRQCSPVARSFQNLSLTINGVNISHQPHIWLSAMDRLYVSYEEAESQHSMSGGAFDDGYPRAVSKANLGWKSTGGPGAADQFVIESMENGNGANLTNNFVPTIPRNENWYNKGYTKRLERFVRQAREQGSRDAAVGARFGTAAEANRSLMPFFERLPISPFYYYDSKDSRHSIPNIQTMQLTAQFVGGTDGVRNAIFQGDAAGAATLDYTTVKPIMHLRWRLSKLSIPQEITLKAPIIREYTLATNAPAAADAVSPIQSNSVSFTNINLEGVPDMILIYYKKKDDALLDASEHHMSIRTLEITIGGSSGKLNSMSRGELYTMYLKNTMHKGLKKIGFYQWSRYNCVAALRPSDIGLERGPGFSYPIQLSVTANLDNFWQQPTFYGQAGAAIDNADDYLQCVIVMYDKTRLVLTADGGAKMDLLKL